MARATGSPSPLHPYSGLPSPSASPAAAPGPPSSPFSRGTQFQSPTDNLGLYSCYQGNRGTQSPQLPWSRDQAPAGSPSRPHSEEPLESTWASSAHPPGPLATGCLNSQPCPPHTPPALQKGFQAVEEETPWSNPAEDKLPVAGWVAGPWTGVPRPTLHQRKALPVLGQPCCPCSP